MSPTPKPGMGRRQFLRNFTIGAGATAVIGACSSDPFTTVDPNATPQTVPAVPSRGEEAIATTGEQITPADLDQRTLVVIELLGGNDGLDTVVPYEDPAYMDLRPTIGLDLETVLPVAGGVGLNPSLATLAGNRLAMLQGVGTHNPDLSHFESMTRWHQGNMDGNEMLRTGFLGRLCDHLDNGAPVTGVSIDLAPSPALHSAKAVTLSVPDPSSGGWLSSDDDWMKQVRSGLTTMSSRDNEHQGLLGVGRTNTAQALDFLDMLNALPETDYDLYPGSDLGNSLSTCARLIEVDSGIRVLHIPWGSFDTHDEHRGSQDYQLMEFSDAVAAFLQDVENRGFADSTLVATISEFGRRPLENAGGTDHGAASVALLAGPVKPGLHGTYPSLTKLDEEDNLQATVGMDEYYATLAESWFGIPASDVLSGSPKPVESLL